MKYRRSISMPPEIYLRLRQHARVKGKSAASIVARLITKHLDAEGAPTMTHDEAVSDLRDNASSFVPSRQFTTRHAEETDAP